MKKIYAFFLLNLLASVALSQDLYDLYSLRTLKITFTEAKYDSILRAWWHANSEDRLPATIEVDGVVYDSVGIQYKGNFTFMVQEWYKNPKLPLNIDMDFIKPNQTLLGYKKIKLGNGTTDPTCIREALASLIYQEYMPAPRTNFMKVYINGQYMGLFSNTESVNKQFLERTYTTKSGTLFKCDPNPAGKSCLPWPWDYSSDPNLVWYGADSCVYYDNYEMKSTYGWTDLLNMIKVLNQTPDQVGNVLNADRVLWHMAVSSVIPNFDTYNGQFIHNYYLYKQKDGLFHMIPSDLNESFKHGDQDLLNGFLPQLNDRPLVYQLLKNPLYLKQYIAHVRTIMEEVYHTSYLAPKVDSIQSLIYTSVMSDPYYRFAKSDFYNNVYDTIFSLQNFPFSTYEGIYSTVSARKQYLLSHPEVAKTPPSVSNTLRNVSQPVNGQLVWITSKVSNATQVDLMVTNNKYGSFFIPVRMFDDGQHQDGSAGDGIYGAAIPFSTAGELVRYYVRAQNTGAMRLDPARAEYVFYSYVVGNAVGIADAEEEPAKLLLYPNPASERVTVKTTGGKDPENLIITDMAGRRVMEYKPSLPGEETELDVSGLVPGIYFLYQEGERLSVQKLTIQR